MSKKRGDTPRRKRYKKEQRLQNAKIWLPTTTAKNIAKSYSKWYGVDLLCAIRELEMLGHTFKSGYKEQVQVSLAHQQKIKRMKKEQKARKKVDDHFGFIAGYTENGSPFGIMREAEEESSDDYRFNEVNLGTVDKDFDWF